MRDVPEQLDSAYAVAHHKERCRDLIACNGFRSVCEVGGGRFPLFDIEEVRDLGVTYTVLDIAQRELDHASSGYRKRLADICAPDVVGRGDRYDFIFSKMLAEHVSNGTLLHRNIYTLLQPGGMAFHFFPTLFTPAFLVNRVLPEALTRRIVYALWPNRAREYSKFPARYSKCFGPTTRMKRFFTDLGYVIEDYRPFYGTGYFRPIPILRHVDVAFSRAMATRLNPTFTSYAWLVLRKPAGS